LPRGERDQGGQGGVPRRQDQLVHCGGKLSFDPQKLIDNATTVIGAIVRSKPSAAKASTSRVLL